MSFKDNKVSKKAAELVSETAKETYLPSEAARQSARAELARIRFHIAIMSYKLTALRAVADRKPAQRKERAQS